MTPVAVRPEPSRARIYTIFLVGVSAISLGAIFIRYAQGEDVPSLLIGTARLIIAALIVTPVVMRRHTQDLQQLKRNDLLLGLVCGFFLALHFGAWIKSLEYTSVLISVTLVTTTPIWTALLEIIFLKTGLRGTLVVGLIITMIGGFMIGIESGTTPIETPADNNLLLAAIYSLIGAFAFSVVLVIGRNLRQKLPLFPYIWLIYGSGGLMLLLVVLVSRTPVFGYSALAYGWMLASGVFPQLIGHSSLNYAVAYVSATYVSLASKMEPIGSAILAFILFNEVPGRWQLIGSIVILIGIIIASIERNSKSKAIG